MNADKMLEDLGYTLYESSNRYLRYRKELDGSYEGRVISFNLKEKRVKIVQETFQKVQLVCYATLEELKAIYKKIEELRWLNNE